MKNKIFGRTSNGILTIELWTLIPALFLFCLFLIIKENSGFNFNSFNDLIILTFIFSCIMGVIYIGNYYYKKIKEKNNDEN